MGDAWPSTSAVVGVDVLASAHIKADRGADHASSVSGTGVLLILVGGALVATTVRGMRNERPPQPLTIATAGASIAATATAKAVMLAGMWEELRSRGLLGSDLLPAQLRQRFRPGDQHGGTNYQSVSKGAAPEDVEDERAVREPINRKNMSLERAHGGNEMDSMDRATTERAATNQQHQWLSGSTRRGVADGLATLPMMAAVAALGEDVDHDLYEDDEEGELC